MDKRADSRLDWIDFSKGFTIILVILGHCYSKDNYVLYWINSFHMPIFFIITGYLIEQKKIYDRPITEEADKLFRMLMIPYYVYSLVTTVVVGSLKAIGGSGFSAFFFQGVKYIMVLYGNSPLWFLSCLFISEIVYLSIRRWNLITRIIVIFLFFLSALVLPHELIILRMICRVGLAVFFLLCGEILKRLGWCCNRWGWLMLLSINMFLSCINGKVGFGDLQFNNRWLFTLNALCGSTAILILSKVEVRSGYFKGIKYLGKNTLVILGTHTILIEIFRLIDFKFLGERLPTFGLYEGIILTILILVAELPIIMTVNRITPFLVRNRKEQC